MRVARLLIATTNRDKLREIRKILSGVAVEIIGLADLLPMAEPQERGRTFEENARAKALHYSAITGETAVADDSGLEIDALDGAPGVYSARYGLPEARSYPEKFALIYRALEERGRTGSSARFVCALALAGNNRILFETRGTVEGLIAREPRGRGGFGYDPILYYPPLARTLAQLSVDEKGAISHRGRAFRSLRQFLEGRR